MRCDEIRLLACASPLKDAKSNAKADIPA